PLNSFSDIPMKILSIQKNPHGKGALVQLYADNLISDPILSDQLLFDYLALMEEDEAEKLNDKESYFVTGKKISRLDEAMVSVLTDKIYNSPIPSVRKGSIYDHFDLNAGVFLCEVDSIKVVP